MTLPAGIGLSFDDLLVEYFVSVIAGVATVFVLVVTFLFPTIINRNKVQTGIRRVYRDSVNCYQI